MKRKIILLFVLASALLLAFSSCTKDGSLQDQIDRRSKELDQLEARDKEIREQLLQRITDLRSKLEKLIDEVEESLNQRIADGENTVMKQISDRFGDMAGRIEAGFATLNSYMETQYADSNRYLAGTFSSLETAKEKIREQAAAALADGDYRLASLMTTYEQDVERTIVRAKQAELSIKGLESSLAKAESLRDLLNNGKTDLDRLDNAYGEMEQAQMDLMRAVAEKTTDVSSLEAIQNEVLRGYLMKAASLLDDMESVKDDVRNTLGESEDLLSEMEDLLSFIDNDIINGVGAAVGDLESSYENAMDILDWLSSIDPSEYYDMVNEANAEVATNLQNAEEAIENLDEVINSIAGESSSLSSDIESNVGIVEGFIEEARNSYDEIMSVRS